VQKLFHFYYPENNSGDNIGSFYPPILSIQEFLHKIIESQTPDTPVSTSLDHNIFTFFLACATSLLISACASAFGL
jgi:hypothetical protein